MRNGPDSRWPLSFLGTSRIGGRGKMIRACDIFCDAGGSSVGAHAADVEIAAGIDMCATASGTFAANFPDALAVTNRLEDVSPGSMKEKTGDIDILLASPECTSHTCAKGGAPRDEASRATAMLVVEYARALRPRWLVLENVIHMRPWSRYGELKHSLQDLGYHLAGCRRFRRTAAPSPVVYRGRPQTAAKPERPQASRSEKVGRVRARSCRYMQNIGAVRRTACRGHAGTSEARIPNARGGRQLPVGVLRKRRRGRLATFELPPSHDHDPGPLRSDSA